MECNISELLGRTLTRITRQREKWKGDSLLFYCTDGSEWEMCHDQEECGESVRIEDICGELDWLVGSTILQAEEVTNQTDPPSHEDYDWSHTWTFYKLATIKGYVTIRWYGESNGYYSERATFIKIKATDSNGYPDLEAVATGPPKIPPMRVEGSEEAPEWYKWNNWA